MNRPTFEHDLRQLQDEVLVMGSMVNKALNQATDALKRRDLHLARYVIRNDAEINRQRFAIEEQALTLIATQQPVVAHDLRLVAAIINIISELERMGDHAKGITRIVELLDTQPPVKSLIQLPRMADKGSEMLNSALDAFLHLDAEAARRVAACDDEVDKMHDQIMSDLLQAMVQDPQITNQVTYLIWAAHNYERFADRVTNICERIIYVVTGQMVEISGHQDSSVKAQGTQPASALYEFEG